MSLEPAHKALEKAYTKLVKLFDKEMQQAPRPVITIQTRGRKNALGWFGSERWKTEKNLLPEINISAEDLNRGVEDIIETLVHEMVHYCNWLRFKAGVNKKRDCSANQYHNKVFKHTCEEIGLNCEKMGRFGWASTSLGDELRTRIEQLKIDTEAFALCRRSATAVAKAPTKMKKWSCSCGINIRAAVELDITCNECGGEFELQS